MLTAPNVLIPTCQKNALRQKKPKKKKKKEKKNCRQLVYRFYRHLNAGCNPNKAKPEKDGTGCRLLFRHYLKQPAEQSLCELDEFVKCFEHITFGIFSHLTLKKYQTKF